jgi:hypothetical protein
LVRSDLDITEFLEGVFEFARDEEGGERDVVVRELDEGEMEVEAVVEFLGGCDGPAWAVSVSACQSVLGGLQGGREVWTCKPSLFATLSMNPAASWR